jgi:hypothetical protein
MSTDMTDQLSATGMVARMLHDRAGIQVRHSVGDESQSCVPRSMWRSWIVRSTALRNVPGESSVELRPEVVAPMEFFPFAPRVGPWERRLGPVLRAATVDPLAIDEELAFALGEDGEPAGDRAKYALALAIVRDVLRAGGQLRLIDSRAVLAWPDWDGEEGRAATRALLCASAAATPFTDAETSDWRELTASSWSGEQALDALATGRLSLCPIEVGAEKDDRLVRIFRLGVRTWSMPYRGREGRSRRFVAMIQTVDGHVPVGILEVGDDAPVSRLRDELLGLTAPTASAWIQSNERPRETAEIAADHLAAIRRTLLPIDPVKGDASCGEILSRSDYWAERARGRSVGPADRLFEKKRIIYMLRLAQGESSLRAFAHGDEDALFSREFREGVRALHDLVVPRVHLEATICGALPPFGEVLGGKLVAALMAHPAVRSIPLGGRSTILREVFNIAALEAILPAHGLLCITTKGLYSRHSAQYHGVVFPGQDDARVKLRKIGETEGATTALFSNEVGQIALRVHQGGFDSGRVARVYGAGGAKRHRILMSVAADMGIPGALLNAGIRRPVYGALLARNATEVIWAGKGPEWLISQDAATAYEQAVHSHWCSRWEPIAVRRLSQSREAAVV